MVDIDPRVDTTTLANGLAVTTVALPHLHTAVCSMFIKVGSRFEVPADNGLSHFVEHMLFRGTEKHKNSLALNTAVERLGSTLHAETGRDYTLFQMGLMPETIPEALDLLGELLGRPRFADIELERALVLQEIMEDYDERGIEINADDIARGLVFDEHPLGQRIIGPKKNVARFTRRDVKRHFKTFYGAENARLCIAGPVEHKRIVDLAAKRLANLPRGTKAEVPPAPVHVAGSGPRIEHVNDAGSQTSLAILFRAIPELDSRWVALAALLRVLDDGMSTRLHYRLADQKGLAYSVNAAIEPLADTALFEISSQTANAKVPTLLAELFAILDGLRAGKIKDEELAKCRTRYRYETLASIDDCAAMAGWFGGVALYYPPPSLEERLVAMSKVKVDDVVAIARDVLVPDRLAMAAVGTLSRARFKEVRGTIEQWD